MTRPKKKAESRQLLFMKSILPILAMILTTLSTLTAVVFCMGMGANSSVAEIRVLKLWMCGLSLLGLAGIVTGIYLLRLGNHGWAAGVAFSPTVIIGIIFIIAVSK
jgi:hypothetical protein